MTACRDKIRPEIIPYFEMVRDVEAGRHVAVVQVDAGWTAHLCFASLRTVSGQSHPKFLRCWTRRNSKRLREVHEYTA